MTARGKMSAQNPQDLWPSQGGLPGQALKCPAASVYTETPSLPNSRYVAIALTKLADVFQMVPGPRDLKEAPVCSHTCFPAAASARLLSLGVEATLQLRCSFQTTLQIHFAKASAAIVIFQCPLPSPRPSKTTPSSPSSTGACTHPGDRWKWCPPAQPALSPSSPCPVPPHQPCAVTSCTRLPRPAREPPHPPSRPLPPPAAAATSWPPSACARRLQESQVTDPEQGPGVQPFVERSPAGHLS